MSKIPQNSPVSPEQAQSLLGDIRHLSQQSRHAAVVAVNAELTLMYWRIGQRVQQETLQNSRADYGQEILPTLSAELVPQYGRGFSARSLWRMVQFASTFSDQNIVATLSQHKHSKGESQSAPRRRNQPANPPPRQNPRPQTRHAAGFGLRGGCVWGVQMRTAANE